jgi:hypothetical protein
LGDGAGDVRVVPAYPLSNRDAADESVGAPDADVMDARLSQGVLELPHVDIDRH